MMLRCTWLVPPAMRPPGAASIPSAPAPSSMRRRRRCRRAASATSNIISEMPSLSSDAAVEAIGPWRWAIAL